MKEANEKDCLDPENKSKCCFFKVANAFLLLANLLLIILGFYYLPGKGDHAYYEVFVYVLGILVTVLITWQIWQTIISRGEIKDLIRANEDLKAGLDTRVDKIYKDINEHVELRNKRHLEIIEAVKRDYESTVEVLTSFVLVRNSEPSYNLLSYAIQIFKQFNNPKNLKAKTAIEVLDAAVNDVLVETQHYPEFVENVSREDICWLYSFDYNKNDCAKFIKNMDKYKWRLERLLNLYSK